MGVLMDQWLCRLRLHLTRNHSDHAITFRHFPHFQVIFAISHLLLPPATAISPGITKYVLNRTLLLLA